MNLLSIGFTVLFSLIFIRTFFWHLQNWQLREYRWDRLKAYFTTADGRKNLWNLWFFRGIFPRPKFSPRIFLIIFLTLFLIVFDYFSDHYFAQICGPETWFCKISRDFAELNFYWKILIYERFLWIYVGIAVFLSAIPVNFKKRKLYKKAREIIQNSMSETENTTNISTSNSVSKNSVNSRSLSQAGIKRIGITGSYGKSSTRKILTHLLKKEFGESAVLTNPENQNTEVAIARLILKFREFFSSFSPSNQKPKKRFLVIEIGAYRRGEIATVCKFLQPEIGILTGINNQHLALFGSQKNIVDGKFELAEACTEKVFFNADNKFLAKIFADKKIQAVPIGISRSSAKILKSEIDKTVFKLYDREFILPWGGDFFVDNAILAIETARELGCKIENIEKNLKTLPPLKKALNVEKLKNGGVILRDLYSQNPNGVLAAIKHLAKFRGRKIFVGVPLLELGRDSYEIHREIFIELAKIKADVFWLKEGFTNLGKEICGQRFYGKNLAKLAKIRKNLKNGEAILFTGRIEV